MRRSRAMARGSGPSGLARGRRRRTATTGELVTRWRDVPKVVRATTSILRAHEAASVSSVEAAVAIGHRIREIRSALDPGEFPAWIREAVPFSERTVRNYMALAAWSDREPRELKRLAHLGPSKLYRLAAMPPGARGKLALRTPIPIPGTDGRKKTIETMTVVELDRVVGGLATPPVPRTPVDELMATYRDRVLDLAELTKEIIARARDVDPSEASELSAELHGLAQSLDAAFR